MLNMVVIPAAYLNLSFFSLQCLEKNRENKYFMWSESHIWFLKMVGHSRNDISNNEYHSSASGTKAILKYPCEQNFLSSMAFSIW